MKGNKIFHCWACENQLDTMHEIAQGVCDSCKASIIRKYHEPLMHDDLLSIISAARIVFPDSDRERKLYLQRLHL